MRCYVPFCQTTTSNAKSNGLTFHGLPENTYYRTQWIELFKREGVELPDDAVVCSKHFLCSDFSASCSEIRRLRANAIPLIVKVCIICLDTDRKLLPMSQYKLITAYENLTGLLLGYDAKLPQTICFECAQRLENFSKFRDKSLRAVTLMVEIIKDHELLSMQNIRYVDRKGNKLISNIVQTVFEPNNCDLYLRNCLEEEALFGNTNSSEKIKIVDPIFVYENNKQRIFNDIECNNDINSCNNTNKALLKPKTCKELNNSVSNYRRTKTKLRNNGKKAIKHFAPKSEDVKTCTVGEKDDSDTNSSHFDHIHIDNLSNGFDDETDDNVWDENNDTNIDYDKAVNIVWCKTQDTNAESKTQDTKVESETDRVNVKNNESDEKGQWFDTDEDLEGKSDIPADDNASVMWLETTPYNDSDDDQIFQTTESPYDEMKQRVNDESVFKCALCFKGFWDEDACNRHTRRHHKIDHSHVKLRVEKPQIVDSAPRIVAGGRTAVPTAQIVNLKILSPVSESSKKNSKNLRVIQIDSGKISGAIKQCEELHKDEKGGIEKEDEKNNFETIKQKSGAKTDQTEINNTDKQVKKVQIDAKDNLDIDNLTQNNRLEDFNCTAESETLPNKINFANQNIAAIQNRLSGMGNLSVSNSKSNFERNNDERFDEVTKVMESNTNKKFFCDYCNRNFCNTGTLQRHMRLHTGEILYSCKLCDYKCTLRPSLMLHMRAHTGKKPFSCPLCPYRTTNRDLLLMHSQSHANSKAPSKYRERNLCPSDRRGENVCSVCAKAFKFAAYLDIHMRIHTGEKPYECGYCYKRFSQKSTMLGHRRTHTGEKPFSCDRCEYKCAMKGNLQRHMKTHTGVKPYSYDVCNFKSIQKGSLKSHMRTDNGEKLFKCNICGKGFTEHRVLIRHLTTHTVP